MNELESKLQDYRDQKKHYLDVSRNFPDPKLYDQLIRINTAIEILEWVKEKGK